MSIRTEYKRIEQSKCNFCFNWFNSACTKKDCIHLCRSCLDKGQFTTCFKVHSPDSKEQYQLFLFKNNFIFKDYQRMENQEEDKDIQKKTLIEDIDVYRNKQIKQLTQKWSDITDQIKKITVFGEKEFQKFRNLFDGLIMNYPTAKEILTEKCKIGSQKNQNNRITQGVQDNREVHQSVYNLNNLSHSILPLNSQNFNIPNLPYNKILKYQKNDQNIKYPKPLQFSKAFSTKVNLKNRNISKKIKRNDVSTSSFNTQRDQKKSLSRNPSKQSLLQKNVKTQYENNSKRLRDLQLISKNQLKAKIYHYLEGASNISNALFLPMTFQVYDAIQNTRCLNKCIQLVSYNIQDLDIKCYMNMLQWSGVEILKLVKVGLTDSQFKEVAQFIKNKNLETLVATSNRLTEASIFHLKNISQQLPSIKYIYLGKNWIQRTKTKDEIKQIESKLVLYI